MWPVTWTLAVTCQVVPCGVANGAALVGAPVVAIHAADDPVEQGRHALDSWWDYNWYDDQADDVRRIELVPPRRPWLPMSLAGWEVYAWVAIGTLLAVLLVILLRGVLYRGPTRLAPAVAPRRGEVGPVEALPVTLGQAAADPLAEARRHYQQGNFGEAMIYLYSHLLLQLDRRQVVRLARGKTNRQYLREIRRGAVARIFEPAMQAFEDVFFGRRPLDRTRFEASWTRVDEFHRLLEEMPA